MSHTASYRSLLLALALLLLGQFAWAQRVSIQTRLDRSEIRIGEQAAVEMTIRTDDLARTRFHLVEDSTGSERFRVLAFAATDTVDLGDGLKEIQAKMIITSFDSTLITLPPVLVETPSGQAVSKPLALNVISPQVDLEHPEKIEPIMAPRIERIGLDELLDLLSRLGFVLPLVLLVILLGLLWRRYRQRTAQQPAVVLPVAEKTLLEQLQERLSDLGALPLETQTDFKTYYTVLTEALRHFLGQLYGIDTMEKTSDELLSAVQLHGMGRTEQRKLEQLLHGADFVKFAKSLPTSSDAHTHTQLALQLAGVEYERLRRPQQTSQNSPAPTESTTPSSDEAERKEGLR